MGYEHNIIGWPEVVELAKSRLCLGCDSSVLELSCTRKSDLWKIGELLRKLAACEPNCSASETINKWLCLILSWLFDNIERIDEPLAEVENLYADFNCPSEIEGFVRYMPAADGYDPSSCSKEENEKRLFDNWKKYLDAAINSF